MARDEAAGTSRLDFTEQPGAPRFFDKSKFNPYFPIHLRFPSHVPLSGNSLLLRSDIALKGDLS